MRIFVSWSGDASREAAELIKEWLPSVVQEIDVWVSSQDIGKGEKWSESLWERLTDIQFGILMVTRENAKAPWIMFEAGALSKTVKSRVIPIMCDLDRLDVANTPLSQLQNAIVSKEEMWQVIVAVNSACERPLEGTRLRVTFERWWPDFETQFHNIKFPEPTAHKPSGAKGDGARLDKIEGALEGIMSTLQRMRNENLVSRRIVPNLKLTRPTIKEEIRTLDGTRYIRESDNGRLRRVTTLPPKEPGEGGENPVPEGDEEPSSR